jgi:hypothetical protein
MPNLTNEKEGLEEKLNTGSFNPKRTINCDQVMWLKSAIDNYVGMLGHTPKNCNQTLWRPILDAGLLTNIMDILDLSYKDSGAAWNAVSSIRGTHLIWQDWKDKE